MGFFFKITTYLAEAIVVYPVEPGDFTSGDIDTPLGHHANTPLRIGCLEGIDIVDEWGFGGDLKITDHTVTLKLKKNIFYKFRQVWTILDRFGQF